MKLTLQAPICASNLVVTSHEMILTAFGPFHGRQSKSQSIAHDTFVITALSFAKIQMFAIPKLLNTNCSFLDVLNLKCIGLIEQE